MLKSKWEISRWLNEMEIKNYTINDDLIIDIDGDAKFHSKPFSQLPVQFGVINGDFVVWNCKLESLQGCPYKVKGDFNCAYNSLHSLEYCPKEIGGVFIFHHNDIATLEYSPDSVGIFKYYLNNIKDLKGFKTQVKEYFEHGCDDKKDQITQFEHLYEYFPHAAFKYLLKLSADQLKAIQQADDLTLNLPINETNQSKKLKL